jgi:hypothetical protein
MLPNKREPKHYLTLTHNSTPKERCEVIAQQILDNDPRLVDINLYDRSIGDDGLSELALALHENTTVTTLDVGKNDINNEGVSRLATALRTNIFLNNISLKQVRVEEEQVAQYRSIYVLLWVFPLTVFPFFFACRITSK